MSASDTTNTSRKRTRTGCLTCRKRKRKCDERKPRCEGCETRGLLCRYGVDITIIQSVNSGRVQSQPRTPQNVGGYTRIRFVDDDDENTAVASTERHDSSRSFRSPVQPGRAIDKDIHISSSGSDHMVPGDTGDTVIDDAGPVESDTVEQYQRPASHTRDDANMDLAAQNLSRTTTNHLASPADSVSQASFASGRKAWQLPESQETELLSHYRYVVGPWIDAGDPESSFALGVLLAARKDPNIYSAILAIAASHKALLDSVGERSVGQDQSIHNQEVIFQNHLHSVNSPSHLSNTLYMLREIICSDPHKWKSTMLLYLDSRVTRPFLNSNGGVDSIIFWLHCRIDLAVSIIEKTPPMLPLTSELADRESSEEVIRSLSRPKSPKRTFQHSLYLLSRSLSLIYGVTSASPSVSPSLSNIINTPGRSFAPSWNALWTENQRWHAERPVEVQQIYQVRGPDINRIDTDNVSQFPILVYTTTLTVVANAIHHITSFILLNHKPRLARVVALPQSSISSIWHAQSIAGIASSNAFPEQWDPVFVAGLFLVAECMSHASQQSTMIEIFDRITASTGMNLDGKIAVLKSGWSTAESI